MDEIKVEPEAQVAMGRNEAKFRAVFEGAAIGIAVVNFEGRPVRCNAALERLLGYTEAELCRMSFPQFTHPDDLQADWEMYSDLIAGKINQYQINKRYLRKDGRIVWVRLTISLVHPQEGDPEFVVAMVEDITRQREFEQKWQKSEERLRHSLEAARMGTWEWDMAGGRITWSEGVHALFGLAPGEFGGSIDDFYSLVHAEDRSRVRQELNAMVERPGRKYYSEMRVNWPDGSTRWLEGRGEVKTDPNGKPVTMLGIVVDITDRKNAELALRNSEESLRATIENTPDVAIQWYDEEGRVLFWNRASENVFGWTASEASHKTLDQLVLDPAEAARFVEALQQVEQTGKPIPPFEYHFRRRDGSECTCLSTVFRIPRAMDKPCFVCMDVDVTQQKQAERSLMEAQDRELRSREEFTRQLITAQEQERQRLAAELHDSLGQNLSIIKNHTYLALAQAGLSPATSDRLNAISDRASETIAEVRSLVNNLRPLQIEKFGLTQAIRSLVEKTAESTRIHLERRIEEIDDAIGDNSATHLYRIVQEALNNLIKHSGATHAILTVERDVKCVRLRLVDNGAGFNGGVSASGNGFGLKSIAERAQMLGGSSIIRGVHGGGTYLTVELPIPDKVEGSV